MPWTLVPRHRALRLAAAVWLAASFVTLVVLLAQPGLDGDSRRPLKVLVPLYFLSFPAGHAGLMAFIELKLALYLQGKPAPGITLEGLALWSALTLLGYLQWFVLLPWIARKCRQVFDALLLPPSR